MKLKLILAAGSAAFFAASTPTAAQTEVLQAEIPADELAVARQIIAVMFPDETRDMMFEDIMAQIAGQFSAASMTDPIFEEPGIRAIMDEFFAGLPQRLMPVVRKHLPSMLEATAVAYTREFDLQELQDILAFAQTDTGTHYFGKVTSLLGDPAVAEANQAYFAELQIIQQAVGPEVRARVMDYLEANPDVLDRIQAGRDKAK
ncbi:hypothetical protein K3152_03280 [Qipengyuania sp. 1NDH17]|uniref:DUF2059 domain-containing protein n=1 Tax=Qipengyuania polymorpha TaxID=2867234 RepID=A0ABS7IWC3_9SPHN|nr:hypothetical protein [Qipengyuania polymorpha]MBX7457259.1 hypothetical protein [Qipengyuania polymorpha]